jgi:hypothetical protein
MAWSKADYHQYLRRQGRPAVPGHPAQRGAWTQAEAQLLADLRAVALRYSWLFYHTYDSRRSDAGFYDVVLAHPTRPAPLYLVELKTQSGKATTAQLAWLHAASQATRIETGIWRPGDLPGIVDVLRP